MHVPTNRTAMSLVLCLLVFALPAQAANPQSESSLAETTLWSRFSSGFQRLPSVDTAVLLGAGAFAATLALSIENPEASARALDGSLFDGGVDYGDLYGSGITIGLSSLGLMLAGHHGRPELAEAGRDLGASFLLASALTWSMKTTIDRRRPNGGPYSFPSGHTAAAFSTLPAVYRHGGPWLGAAATALAVGTAAARMEDQRHYLSDVLFGAALGYAAGRAVVGESIPWGDIWRKLTFSGKGVGVRVKF